MKKYVATLLLYAAVTALGVGCSSPYVAQKPPQSAYRPVSYESPTKKVKIVSEPAGARIEINDDYVGDAPITVEIPQWVGRFTKDTVIRAIPNRAGDYGQSKYFSKGSVVVGATEGQIPSRILFDMHLGPSTPTVNVNVIPAN
jgi:hypothetical protein